MINRDYWGLARKVNVASVFGYSDQYSTSRAVTYAVNGNTGDYWRPKNSVGAYIVVELTEAAPVESLRWYVGNTSYIATAFTVAGSNDGEAFVDLFSGGCSKTSGWQNFNWTNETPYKYIRVTCDAASSDRIYVYELEFCAVDKQYFDKSYGKYIVAVFDGPVSEPVESDVSHFSVTAPMAVVGEDGNLIGTQSNRTVVGVMTHPSVENALLITLDSSERLDECWKPVVLAYDGSGSLTGYGRPVEAFEVAFEPQGIAYKGDQNDEEHIEISSITASGTLIRLYYSDYKSTDEHIEISNITATGILTHVDDI